MTVPASSVWEALDARAGALHRELTQAMQQVAAIERLVHDQRPAGHVRRNERSDQAVIRSAVAYMEACLHEDSAQMVKTFIALRDAVSAWLLIPIREPFDEELLAPQKSRDPTQDLPGAGRGPAGAPAPPDAHAGDGV